MTTPPGISVVLPCYNRGAYAAHWLDACAWWQPYAFPLEVIVVDDGGSDHVEAVVERAVERGLDVRYLRLRGAGSPRNNAQARNAGIRAARHPLVLNSDPDVVFVTDVLTRLAAEWRYGVFCTLGGYYPLTRTATRALWRRAEQHRLTSADYLSHASARHNLVHRPDGVYGLHGAFLCDRETLEQVRGYDERFTLWGYEDRDLLMRLDALGLMRRFVPGAAVVHQWHPPLRADQEPRNTEERTRVLWQVGWQQARASAAIGSDRRDDAIVRNLEGWGDSGPLRGAAARPDLPRDERSLGLDAYRFEAQIWRREGAPRIALERLRVALSRWWERGDVEPAPHEARVAGAGSIAAAIAEAHASDYAGIGALAIECVLAASEAGEPGMADAALTAAERLPGAHVAVAVAYIRAKRLIENGEPHAAARLLEGALDIGGFEAARESGGSIEWTDATAQLVELALRDGAMEEARRWTDRARARLQANAEDDRCITHANEDSGRPHLFERLLFDAYGAALEAGGGEPHPCWPIRIGQDCAGEFLFSAAMRARRAGFWFGARALFGTYLLSNADDDEGLYERAMRFRDEAAVACGQAIAAR
jgi:GT2 family glycosyltransferase